MELWETLLAAFGGTAALLLLLGYLGQTAIKHWLDKDIDAHKAKLQLAEVASTERLKTALQRTTLEHQVRFTRLHEQRAEVIRRTYEMLVELMWASAAATNLIRLNSGTTPQDDMIEADKRRVDLYRYFTTNRIYLPADACENLDALIEQTRRILISVDTYQTVNEYAPAEVLKEKRDVMLKAFQYFSHEVPKPMADLERAFRGMLDPNTPEFPAPVVEPLERA